MKVKKLLHTRMRVTDMDQTIKFYTDVLGLEVVERKVSPRGSHFEVDNLDDTIRLLRAKRIKITDGPTRTACCSRFIFIDPRRIRNRIGPTISQH